MDTILAGVVNKQNAILTSLQGFERSRFLLKAELLAFADRFKAEPSKSFERIVHVCDSDRTVDRICDEIKHMPFKELDLRIAKCYANETNQRQSHSWQSEDQVDLVICNLQHVLNDNERIRVPSLHNALIVFDGLTLENIEGTCCEIQEKLRQCHKVEPKLELFSPSLEFGKLASECWSIILACNAPIDGLEAELGSRFPIVISEPSIVGPHYKTNSSVITHVLDTKGEKIPMTFDANEKHPNVHNAVGTILEDYVNSSTIESGGIVIFFPSYGRMVEYHSAWQKSGLFSRLNLPYGRENRGGDLFKNGLLNLLKAKKSIFMVSIRYHKDETLAEFVLNQARLLMVVGLPYPFTNDTWDARVQYNNQTFLTDGLHDGRISGDQLYKCRAIEFMNGVLKRCLGEFRFRDCNLALLDSGLKFERNKLARELGNVTEEEHQMSQGSPGDL